MWGGKFFSAMWGGKFFLEEGVDPSGTKEVIRFHPTACGTACQEALLYQKFYNYSVLLGS